MSIDIELIPKIIFIVVLFIVTVLLTVLPYVIEKKLNWTWRHIVLLYLSCLACGVFIGTCFLILTPNVIQIITNKSTKSVYPLAEIVIAGGFLMTLVAENITEIFIHRCQQHARRTETNNTDTEYENDHGVVNENDSLLTQQPRSQDASGQALEGAIAGYILSAAISFHALFDGFTIGLYNRPGLITDLFVGVSFHKSAVALALGVSLVRAQFSLSKIIIIGIVSSLTTLIGGIIALTLESTSFTANSLISGILQGIATGTLFYVAFIELLSGELQRKEGNRSLKIIFMLLGFILIFVILNFSTN